MFTTLEGFSSYAVVNFGLAFWIPTFFQRTYGWDAAAASRVQGLLTMSIGVTDRRRDDTVSSLLQRADAALYAAKHDGRNCVRHAAAATYVAQG